MLMYCNMIYRRASAIVFQTKYEQSCFSSRLRKKSFVISNPVSVTDVNGIIENRMEISTAGRLVPQKNHALLIDAIALIAIKYPKIQCNIYGEGELRRKLDQRIQECNLEMCVNLSGNKTDIHKWIAQSGIFVLSSEYEGLSNALVEAMMLGKACITTDYPGADEVIRDGETGIIVPRGDSARLAEAIGKLLDSESDRKRLGENAKKAAEKYRPSNVIRMWEDLIWSAAGKKPRNRAEER